MVDKRNADFQDLSKRLGFVSTTSDSVPAAVGNGDASIFGQTPQSPTAMGKSPKSPTVPEVGVPIGVYESDVLFWMVSW